MGSKSFQRKSVGLLSLDFKSFCRYNPNLTRSNYYSLNVEALVIVRPSTDGQLTFVEMTWSHFRPHLRKRKLKNGWNEALKIAADADDVIIGSAFHLIDDDLRTFGDISTKGHYAEFNWTQVHVLRPDVINELWQLPTAIHFNYKRLGR